MKLITFSTSKNRRYQYFKSWDENLGDNFDCSAKLIRFSLPISLKNSPDFTTLKLLCDFSIKKKLSKNTGKLNEILFKLYTYIGCYFLACSTRKLLTDEKPGLIVLYNGYAAKPKAIEWVAKSLNIGVIYIENGALPNTTTVDGRGINYANSLPRKKSFYQNYKPIRNAVIPQPVLVARAPRKGKTTAEPIQLPERFLFIPFQVESDSQIIINSPWIRGMRQLYNIINSVSEQIDDPDLKFVIKEHPSSSFNYPELKNTKRILFANHNITQEILEQCEGVITVNSSVGLEALLFKKKVITLGNAFYNIPGIAKHVCSEHQLVDTINSLQQKSLDQDLINKFLIYLKDDYLIPDDYRSPTNLHWTALIKRLQSIKGKHKGSLEST